MNERKTYIERRLLELDLTAETRPLEDIEKEEELMLVSELKKIVEKENA